MSLIPVITAFLAMQLILRYAWSHLIRLKEDVPDSKEYEKRFEKAFKIPVKIQSLSMETALIVAVMAVCIILGGIAMGEGMEKLVVYDFISLSMMLCMLTVVMWSTTYLEDKIMDFLLTMEPSEEDDSSISGLNDLKRFEDYLIRVSKKVTGFNKELDSALGKLKEVDSFNIKYKDIENQV